MFLFLHLSDIKHTYIIYVLCIYIHIVRKTWRMYMHIFTGEMKDQWFGDDHSVKQTHCRIAIENHPVSTWKCIDKWWMFHCYVLLPVTVGSEDLQGSAKAKKCHVRVSLGGGASQERRLVERVGDDISTYMRWFPCFFNILTSTSGNDPLWLMCFKQVETTNEVLIQSSFPTWPLGIPSARNHD